MCEKIYVYRLTDATIWPEIYMSNRHGKAESTVKQISTVCVDNIDELGVAHIEPRIRILH